MPPAQAGVASAVISSSRQFGNVLGVAVMGAMLGGMTASGASAAHEQAFATATHGPWWLAVACGLLVAVAGWLTTSGRSRELARVVAEPD
jgi:p-aminobenzoyl-glutamate transporter AbgT